MTFKPILQPGRNCWRIRRADRLAFLVDGDAYFNALYDALGRAERDIMILSWDVYSDLRLGALQGDERSLADFLDDRLQQNNELQAHILNWDFAVLFAMSREWLPIYKLGWKTHPRLQFQMDDQHPVGASHHQKVVVIDRQLAFAGGLDITRGRWDTPQHLANDPRRKQVDGTLGRPYHDVQMAVSGAVADALHDLARERWRRASGQPVGRPERSDVPPWPSQLQADLEQVDVAISRTMPAFQDYGEIREVEQLYLDVIAAARDYIYIENQYFTCPGISAALARRLQESQGPEIIINLPLETEGWLAQNSMDVIRVKLLKDLRAADRYQRLAVYYPCKDDLASMPINLHAKVVIADDRFVRVGSSNLNNRSMGLDTECDLAVECRPDQQRIKQGIVAFRNRLLAEHLGRQQEEIEAACLWHDSLIEAIESARGNPARSLMPLQPKLPRYRESLLTESELVDPEQPVNVDQLLYHVVPEKQTTNVARRVIGWLISLLLLLGLAVAWRYTPLAQWLDLSQLTATIDDLRNSTLAPGGPADGTGDPADHRQRDRVRTVRRRRLWSHQRSRLRPQWLWPGHPAGWRRHSQSGGRTHQQDQPATCPPRPVYHGVRAHRAGGTLHHPQPGGRRLPYQTAGFLLGKPARPVARDHRHRPAHRPGQGQHR